MTPIIFYEVIHTYYVIPLLVRSTDKPLPKPRCPLSGHPSAKRVVVTMATIILYLPIEVLTFFNDGNLGRCVSP